MCELGIEFRLESLSQADLLLKVTFLNKFNNHPPMSEQYISKTLIHKLREDSFKGEVSSCLISQKQAVLSKRIEFSLEYQKINQEQPTKAKVFTNITDFKNSLKKNTYFARKMLQKHSKFASILEYLPKNQQRHRFSSITPIKQPNFNLDCQQKIGLQKQSPPLNFSFLERVERRKKSKDDKYKIVKNFGLSIKTMEITEDIQRQSKKKNKKPYAKNLTLGGQNLQGYIAKKACSEMDSIRINDFSGKILPKKKTASFSQTNQSIKKDSLNNKLKTMLESGNQFLKTFGCFKVQLKKQKDCKFKFYVGNGNNKTLIVSTFRKRSWWSQTSDPKVANFVWTQIKHLMTLQKMQLSNDVGSKEDKHQQKTGIQWENQQTNKDYCQISKQEHIKAVKMPDIGHNHISKGYLLGNKKTLFQNLKSYYQYKNSNLLQIIPLTFFIDEVNSKRFQQFENSVSQNKDAIWIVKPGENSNRGRGIFVSNSLQQIKERIERKRNSKRTYIIQKYLTNVFLYQKRKFDIRTYMLLLSIQGVTKFFWYKEGYIRTSSQIFDLKDLKNEFIHLTNDAIQIKNNSYGQFQNGNKLSYNQFQQYLDHNYLQKDYSVKSLHQQMKKMSKEAIISTYYKLDSRNYAIQLFGLDFIIDNNFKPWLIEINTNPCLQLTSPVLERIIPSLIENVFRLGIDPIFQPESNPSRQKYYYLYPSCLLNNKFEVIFDSMVDGDSEWMEKSRSVLQSPSIDEKAICQSQQKI